MAGWEVRFEVPYVEGRHGETKDDVAFSKCAVAVDPEHGPQTWVKVRRYSLVHHLIVNISYSMHTWTSSQQYQQSFAKSGVTCGREYILISRVRPL